MSAEDAAERLDRLSEEFVERMRAGEAPTVAEYASRDPDLAAEIERLFPVLQRMEGFKEDVREELGAVQAAQVAGTELGEYRLIREIGRGGMGVVYEAVQETLDRRVALKMLPPNLTQDPRFLERFRLEARAAGRLQHANVVPVIGIGEHDGIHYFAMQYIEGRGLDALVLDVRARVEGAAGADAGADDSLVERLLAAEILPGGDPGASGSVARWSAAPARSAIDIGRTWFDNAARLVLQAAEGVAAAHAQGVLHRDLKPSNLMVDNQGKVWITDFGLCKEEGSDDLTHPGDMLGTLRYMPPERLEGASDVQGDVYGLGVTLYELVTLRPAYPGDDHAKLLAQIASEAPPRPRRVEPRIPADLEAIVLKATARDKRVRYATAEALAADLRAYLEGRPIAARPPSFAYHLRSAVRRHRALTVTLVGAFVAIVASTVFTITSLQDKEAATRFQGYVANVAAAHAASLAMDPDATMRRLDAAAPELRGWEWHHIHSRVDRSLRTTHVGVDRVWSLAWHPDGTLFAIAAGDAVRVFDDAAGAERFRLQTHGAPFRLAWSRDGSRLAVAATRGIEIWAWPARRREALVQPGTREPVFAWMADGRRLAVGGADGILRILEPGAVAPEVMLPARSTIKSIATHPTKPWVATGTWDGRATLWDLASGEARWTRQVSTSGLHGIAFVGEAYVAGPTERPHVQILDVQGGALVRTLAEPDKLGANAVAATPDGNRLVVGTPLGITAYDVRTWEPLVSWEERGIGLGLAVHPSGARAATLSRDGGIREWGLDADADPRLLTGHVDDVSAVAYAPSGAFLVSGGIGISRSWDAQTGEQQRAWIGNRTYVARVAVSPDSTLVAVADGSGEVALRDVETDRVRARLGGHGARLREVAFAPDGSRLYVAAGDGTLHEWDVERAARLRTREDAAGGGALAVHPSGRWLAVGNAAGRLELLDASSLEVVWAVDAHAAMLTRVVFAPRSDRIVSVSQDGAIRLWRRRDGSAVREARSAPMHSLAISPDETRIAVGGKDGAIRMLDAETLQLVFTRGRINAWVNGLAFSPDGRQLAAAESAARVRILDTVPLRERMAGHRERRARRRKAERLVDELEHVEPHLGRVIAQVRARTDLEPALREAALREAYRRHGSADGLVAWLWRAVGERRASRLVRSVAYGLAADMDRAAGHRNRQDRRRATLLGAALARLGNAQGAIAQLQRSRAFNEGREPWLFAVDLAFLAMCHAQLVQRDDAVAALSRLEALVQAQPDLVDERLRGFLTEAREAVQQMRKR